MLQLTLWPSTMYKSHLETTVSQYIYDGNFWNTWDSKKEGQTLSLKMLIVWWDHTCHAHLLLELLMRDFLFFYIPLRKHLKIIWKRLHNSIFQFRLSVVKTKFHNCPCAGLAEFFKSSVLGPSQGYDYLDCFNPKAFLATAELQSWKFAYIHIPTR